MSKFLKVIKIFFIVLGVIFFIIILFGIYFFVTDPLNLRPLLSSLMLPSGLIDMEEQTSNINNTIDKNPALSSQQERVLESFGVDPSIVPTEISPELEECFVQKLGEERVNEIKQGGIPTIFEFNTARSCVN